MDKTTKRRTNAFFVIFMSLALMFGGMMVGAIPTGVVTGVLGLGEAKSQTVMSYLPFIGIIGVTLLYVRLVSKHDFSLFFKGLRGNNLKMVGLGLLTGFLMNSFCILPAILTGNLKLSIGNISIEWLLICFVLVFIQSSAEEMLDRGYVFFNLRSRYGFVKALVINSVVFSLMHLTNDGITLISIINIVLIGVFFTFAVHYLDSLWFAMANHAAWNFTQNFVYGLPNSGLPAENSLIKVNSATHGVFYDTTFGIEGTIVATVVVLCATILLYLYAKKKTLESAIEG